MQHQRTNRTLGRVRSERRALLRGLALSLIEHGVIKTTEGKAKELRPFVERLVTAAKTNTASSRRTVASRLGEAQDAAVTKLFGELAEKYKERKGGYTRVVKMGRTQAGRDEAVIEFV